MPILVITTGGTIGAMPYKDTKHPPKVTPMPAKGQDFVRLALQKIPNIKTRCVSLEQRDSKEIDDVYWQEILNTIKQAPETSVMITYGTDTIIAAAEALHKQQQLDNVFKNKTLLLTGAMVALSCGAESDGLPNMRFALQRLNEGQMQTGVYIVLSDYADEDAKAGWQPRMYKFAPGQYTKIYDPEDARRNRIKRK
ncbi:MAG: asparaginase domain-containing protein [Alphaproteobacteria bacterium]